MSVNKSLRASPASSSVNVTSGVTGQPCALPATRRNSFDMVIAIANSRAAAGIESDVTAQASSSAVSDSSPQNPTREDCTSRNRKNKTFDVESQTWTDSFEEVELQDQFWPTFSTTGPPMKGSDAQAVALAFQAQAQTVSAFAFARMHNLDEPQLAHGFCHTACDKTPSKHLKMLEQHAQALRDQITDNATLLFFLRIGSKEGYSDPIIAVMRNGKDTSAGVVTIKGGKELITLVEDVSAPSDMSALQAVFERSKIDLALAMNRAKADRNNGPGGVANRE